MNNENSIKRDDKLDLVSMIIGIISLCIPVLGMIYAPIAGLILAFKCKEKTKKRKAGIILNIIALVLQVGFLIVFLLAMSTDSITYDEYEANKTFTNLSMYIPEDWIESDEEDDWGFNSAKTYVYRNFEYIDNWENTDFKTDIIKGGEKNKKSLCEITIKDYSESYKMYESFTNQNYSDSEKYKLNKENFDISKNDILLEEKLTKKDFNDIEFEYAVDKSTNSKIHYYFLDAGNNGLYEIVIWDMKNCDKYIEHIEESFELDESSSNNVQNDNEMNNEATENNQYNVIKENFDDSNFQNYNFINVKTYDESSNGTVLHDSKSWIKYEDSNKIEIKRSSGCIGNNEPIHYELFLNNGILTITDMISENLDSYTFNNITNIKQVMEYSLGQSCADIRIVILSEDGKIYYHTNTELVKNGTLKYDFSTLESEFKLLNSDYIFDKIGYSLYRVMGFQKLGAIIKNGEQACIYLDTQEYIPKVEIINVNLYGHLIDMAGQMLSIGFDNSIWFEENKYIVDQKYQSIYINYGFYASSYDLIYIIDRQGYLYSINSKGLNTVATKISDKKVIKIGIDDGTSYGKSILVFEDNNYIEFRNSDTFGV